MSEAKLLETLEAVSGARSYCEWIFRRVEPHLGHCVLDVGSGLDDFSDLFLRRRSRKVILSDASETMTARLRERYRETSAIEVMRLDIAHAVPRNAFSGSQAPDTITCFNVLEHLEDDVQALRNMKDLVPGGGRMILLVPALECLHGSLDRMLGHHRRYTPQKLGQGLRSAGWSVLKIEYFNFFGIVSWFLGGRVFRQVRLRADVCGWLDHLVPVLSFLERLVKPPIGQSLIAVAEISPGSSS